MKRDMMFRVSQMFCEMICDGAFEVAVEFGRRHLEFIVRDRWSDRGGGMVVTALFCVCGYKSKLGAAPSLRQPNADELLKLILHEMDGNRWINDIRPGLGTPLSVALKNRCWGVAQSLLNISKNINTEIGRPIEHAICNADFPEFTHLDRFLDQSCYKLVIDDEKDFNNLIRNKQMQSYNILYDRQIQSYNNIKQKIWSLCISIINATLGPQNQQSTFFLPKEILDLIYSYLPCPVGIWGSCERRKFYV